MSDPAARTFNEDFKRFFLRGLVVILPSVLTLWIVVKAYQFVDGNIAAPINNGIQTGLIQASRVWEPLQRQFEPTEEQFQKQWATIQPTRRTDEERVRVVGELRAENIRMWWTDRWYMQLIGLVVAIVAVYVAGRLLGGFFGRRIYRRLERLITSVPVFKQIYPYVKQIVDFLFSDDRPIKFNRVVVVQYPRKGVWAIGFLTGQTMRSIADESGDAVTVFIPSSPTPFTGYTVTVPRSEAIEVPISVDEALRFTVSGGVLVPTHQAVEPVEASRIERAAAKAGLIAITGGESAAEAGSGPDEPATSEEPRQRDAI
jgi:uncharacterized membrane protein